MACSCTFKISFFKDVQPSWTPLPVRAASQGTLSTSLLNRPKSALLKSEVAVLLTPLLTSPRIESYHFVIAVPKTASNHHITHKSFSVHKQEVQRGTFPSWLTHQLCQEFICHTLQEPPRLFLSDVLYFQQTSATQADTQPQLSPVSSRFRRLFHTAWEVARKPGPRTSSSGHRWMGCTGRILQELYREDVAAGEDTGSELCFRRMLRSKSPPTFPSASSQDTIRSLRHHAIVSLLWLPTSASRLKHSEPTRKSQNRIGWKRPLRSSSPTVNLTLPRPPLHHVPKQLIQTSFKYLQGWRLNHFPGQPVPMPDNPLGEEKFPNIQSKPPLAQLEAISSCPITCYLGEETDPHLSTTSFQVVVESDKVSPQPPFLQAKQSQLPQPLLIRLLLQKPLPMLDNPLGEDIFPNIQSEPPLAQLEAISSCPIASYFGEKTDTHLTTTSFQVVVESHKVSPQPPFLQAKQPQFPQPLLIRLVLQTLHQLRCPSLDTLQHLHVSLVVRGPKLNAGFEVRPHQCRVQGHNHFPGPAGHTIFDTSQDAIGLLGHLGTLLAHIQAAVNQHPRVLFHQAAFQPLFPKPVALHGVAVTQVQDLALGLVEPHTIDLGPSIQPVQVPLQSLPTLKQINTPAQLGVICKLTEGALDPLVQIIDKDVKQNWPQHRALGNATCDRPPTGVNSIHHNSLDLAIQPRMPSVSLRSVGWSKRQGLLREQRKSQQHHPLQKRTDWHFINNVSTQT
ncbi:hypothetical protein QYF61_013821 [Mycteria americana]|uniref:Uncharacterized protein n=1 Tax=Mycteria americana TaxID=33587 RepID=A0AAN7NSK2_MYCAM|nr:hypothetical protein QYF61_013821 [Mycteria americana]